MKLAPRSSRAGRLAPPCASRVVIASASLLLAACDDADVMSSRIAVSGDAGHGTTADADAQTRTGLFGEAGWDGGVVMRDANGAEAAAGPTRDGSPDTERPVSDAGIDRTEGVEASVPVSLRCGDGVRGLDEECDDGNVEKSDFCTSACRVRDRIAVGPTEDPSPVGKLRTIPRGQHVAAVGRSGAALLFVDESTEPSSLGVILFGKDGTRRPTDAGVVVSDSDPVHMPADAHVVALPNDKYAVVWTAFGGSSLHVALRLVDGSTGALSDVSASSADGAEFSDAVWTGSELDVAWTASSGGTASNRVAVRRYDAEGSALGAASFVSSASADAALPTLAPFANGVATAWIERDANSSVDYVARSGGNEWRVGPFSNSSGTSPALIALDASHLLLVAPPLDYDADAGVERARLFGAVLDDAAPGSVTPFPIAPIASGRATDPTRDARFPALAVAAGSVYLSWALGPGDATPGTDLLLKEMPWRAGVLDDSLEEVPLPRDAERQSGFQYFPTLAGAPWAPRGALLAAWEDDGRTFGLSERLPDVLAELIPLPLLRRTSEEAGHD